MQSEAAQPGRYFLPVCLRGVLQEQIVVADMTHADTASEEMTLDVRKLHHHGKADRGHIETFFHQRRLLYLALQPGLKRSVGPRVEIARRGTVVDFHCYTVLGRRQVGMVVTSRGLVALAGIRYRRLFIQQTHADQQVDHALTSAFHPDIDIPRLTAQFVGIEPRIGLAFQDGRSSTGIAEQLCQSCRLMVLEVIHPSVRLCLADPLHRQLHRRMLSGRQLRYRRIQQPL